MSTNIVTFNFKIYDSKLLYVFCECVGLMAAKYVCNLCALSHRKNVSICLQFLCALGLVKINFYKV
jgi:hypothetical protein